jgi:hypothetical protein
MSRPSRSTPVTGRSLNHGYLNHGSLNHGSLNHGSLNHGLLLPCLGHLGLPMSPSPAALFPCFGPFLTPSTDGCRELGGFGNLIQAR